MSDTESKAEPVTASDGDDSRAPSAGAASSDVKPEPQSSANEDPAENETVSIKVTDNQTEVTFRVKRKTPLHRVMDSFCKRTGKDPKSLRFLFDGERLNREDTPGSLGMEDDDKIEALNQQTGGC